MNNLFTRTIGLLGESGYEKLSNSTVAIFGLGGVGGTAAEALVRSGVKSIVIVDFDKVDASNINRQILYTFNDIGKSKVECASKHLSSINPELCIKTIEIKVDSNIGSYLKDLKIDYIVDAIDDVKGKIALATYAASNNIPIIMSMGMANRMDASSVSVVKLNRTENDPLAKKMRYELKHAGVDITKINVACSKEMPLKDGTALHSMIMVPSSGGLNIAGFVIKELTKSSN